jgi:hypothetical protein
VSPNPFPYELPLQAKISSAQAKAFLEVIRSALIFRSSSDVANLYIHSDDRNAIVISFDGSWHPFLCETRGYNEPSSRLSLNHNNDVLRMIAKALRYLGRDQRGGRTFLNSQGVVCVEDQSVVELIKWEWPIGDLVSDVMHIVGNRVMGQ